MSTSFPPSCSPHVTQTAPLQLHFCLITHQIQLFLPYIAWLSGYIPSKHEKPTSGHILKKDFFFYPFQQLLNTNSS